MIKRDIIPSVFVEKPEWSCPMGYNEKTEYTQKNNHTQRSWHLYRIDPAQLTVYLEWKKKLHLGISRYVLIVVKDCNEYYRTHNTETPVLAEYQHGWDQVREFVDFCKQSR